MIDKKKNSQEKYRYFMCGMFFPTDGEEYEIIIPSPFARDSKDDAMKDGSLGYRFGWLDDLKEPAIIIYEHEKFKAIDEGNKKYLQQWVDGSVLKTYTFEEFKNKKGYIRMLKPELKGKTYIDAHLDFVDTDKSFADVFPNMDKTKLYYIDNEAYYIEETDESE